MVERRGRHLASKIEDSGKQATMLPYFLPLFLVCVHECGYKEERLLPLL